MPGLCFYFQVHQPERIRKFSHFDSSREFDYFDDDRNRQILQKVAAKSYLPANALMLDLIKRHQGRFRVAYSITGVAMEQFERYSPETLESFKRLADTGCVEFLGETYYHSLSSVFDEAEFRAQIRMHDDMVRKHFGSTPRVFRNTELIYDDAIGRMVSDMGYEGIVAEGVDDILQWRSPNYMYTVPGTSTKLLLKNYSLSDDIAFRFSNREWNAYPLMADTFASWVHAYSGSGDLVNLFMDYETFGEHQWESTGIFRFLDRLPEEILRHLDWKFITPSEAIDRCRPVSDLPFSRLTSWADVDRDLTAWLGNGMQESALKDIHDLSHKVDAYGDPAVRDIWRKLQTSDHFYYMCTKWSADGDVHAYFSPFDSPYDAFVNYMNIVKDFSALLGAASPVKPVKVKKEARSNLAHVV